MNSREAIKYAFEMSHMVLTSYFSDFSDEELLKRPGKGCNHIAWQLGHLISSGSKMVGTVSPGSEIQLPEGFDEAHSKENNQSDDASQFLSKDQYLELLGKVKDSTAAALDKLTEEDLAKEGPESMRDFCPTVGAYFMLIATHPMMHAGQLVPLRRELEKPVVI